VTFADRWLTGPQRLAVARAAAEKGPTVALIPPSAPLDDWGRRFMPTYFALPPSQFHQQADTDLQELHEHRGSRLAYIAPRESAKSTRITQAYVLRAACERWEPYILIVSRNQQLASKLLDPIRQQLEANEELAKAYPSACGLGPSWNVDGITLRNGVRIEAMGIGGQVRGRRHMEHRPSLVVIDDVQKNDDIFSELIRQRAMDWVTRDLMPSGSNRTNYISVGTALHEDCVAVKLLSMPGWKGRVFQAVLDWPTRMDLWAEWERLLTNLADEDRDAKAQAYYEAWQDEMLTGSRVLWPAYKPLPILMRNRAEIGPSAFDTEYQGDPKTSVGSEWPPEYFERPDFLFDSWPNDLRCKVYTLDPSKGKTDKPRDYQAHVFGGLGTDGILYVEAVFAREAAGAMVGRSLNCIGQLASAGSQNPISGAVVEENIFGELLRDEFERQREILGCGSVPYRPVDNTENKVVRIRRLDGRLSRGQIRVKNTVGGRELLKQLRGFPTAAHDDGPDALEMLDREITRLAKQNPKPVANPQQYTHLGFDPRKQKF
jgi:predicted phage terminase large subunit-like protein